MTGRLARMAWANLWRHPRRTVVASAIIGAGVALLACAASVLAARPELAGTTPVWSSLLHAAVFAIAGATAFGVTLAAAFERHGEHAVLAAIGTHPTQLLLLMLMEVVALALLGLALGVALGMPLLSRLIGDGIELGGRFPTLRGAWLPATYARSALGLFATVLAAGCYPALRAARTDPASGAAGDRP